MKEIPLKLSILFTPTRYAIALRYRYYIAAFFAAFIGVMISITIPNVIFYADDVAQKAKRGDSSADHIRVGVLHSLTGTMAVSERPVADAILFAIDALNQKGGVLGRKIEPVLIDGASDWALFAKEAERLIVKERVSAIFGCWTSACRKTVRPVFEAHDHVLFYPVQYEGLEQSPNIVYAGAAPNQQIIPATKWALDYLGKKIFIIGSDYVFPRTAGEIIRAQVTALNGDILGEIYLPLGEQNFDQAIAAIQEAKPDVIFNTINGDSNIGFYQALRRAGITADAMPVMSFSLAETEVQAIGPALVAGDYAARNYFQTIDNPGNKAFLEALRENYGPDILATAPMEAGYFSVYFWAQAVQEAGSSLYRRYRHKLLGQSLQAPGGLVYLDPENRHVWRQVLIGQAKTDGHFDIIWSSGRPVRPIPYPSLRTKPEWTAFLKSLQEGWDGQWAAPSPRTEGLQP